MNTGRDLKYSHPVIMSFPKFIRCLFLVTALLSPPAFPVHADAPTAATNKFSLLEMLSDPVLVNDFYRKNRVFRVVQVADDGAVGANIAWEQGTSPKWFIEEQREGGDMIQAGVALKDPQWIDRGIKVLDWGFSHQAADGSFTGTKDAVHSVSFFVEAVSRAILLLQQGHLTRYDAKVQEWLPKLQKAAQWMIPASADETSRVKDLYPFGHRYFLCGVGLGQTALLLHDDAMAGVAADYIRLGLKNEQADGTFPEKGGFDAGYQSYGMSLACHYYTICTDPVLAQTIQTEVVQGLERVLKQMRPDGTIDISTSTRDGHEVDRTGKPKGMNYRSLTQTLIGANLLTGNPRYLELAEKTALLK